MSYPLPQQEYLDQAARMAVSQRIIQAQFGDGYSQEQPNGINNQLRMWSLTWTAMPRSARDDLVTKLLAVGKTDYFTWTAFNDTVERKYKVTNDGWSESYTAGNLFNISLSLREVK
jgi:phage-related protein